MRVLFDSHALVWFLRGDRGLPNRVRAELENPETEFVISAVCIWEIATKVRIGKWREARDVMAMLDRLLKSAVYLELPITLEHARTAGSYAWRHRDPFDRLLAAQSQIEGVPLITADPVFRAFGTSVLW